MSELAFSAPRGAAIPAQTWHSRAVLAAAVVFFAVAGAWLSADTASVQAARDSGPELTRLLQAMAALKAVMAAAAVWLVDWRLRYAAGPWLAAGYILAVVAMAAAPGVMFHLAHVIAGGVLFHAGLVVLVLLGCTDRATAGDMLARAVLR
jgi:hypothetical protein